MGYIILGFLAVTSFSLIASLFFQYLVFTLCWIGMYFGKLHKHPTARLIISIFSTVNGAILYFLWLFNIGWNPETEPLLATTSIFIAFIIASVLFLLNTLKLVTTK